MRLCAGENLESVPVRFLHNAANEGDVIDGHIFVEQVRHRVDKN